jgi:hypothetical protein
MHVAYCEIHKRERAMKVKKRVGMRVRRSRVRVSVRASEVEGGGCRVRVVG